MVADGYTKALEGQSFMNFMEWVTSESFSISHHNQYLHKTLSEQGNRNPVMLNQLVSPRRL